MVALAFIFDGWHVRPTVARGRGPASRCLSVMCANDAGLLPLKFLFCMASAAQERKTGISIAKW
jgi:hypothetical protein